VEKPDKLVCTPLIPGKGGDWRSIIRTNRINNDDFRKNWTIIIDFAMHLINGIENKRHLL